MANRKKISLLKSQRAKLKKQRALATTPKAKALVDRRIQQVTVKIENAQKLLKGSPTPKALPPAKNQLKGASTPKALSPAKTRTTGRPSSRRAQAAAKQARAAQGTTGGKRVGQPAGAANRLYGAERVNAAVRRAQMSTAARTAGKVLKGALKGATRLVAGRDDGSGSALMAAMAANDVINAARGSTAKERNAKKSEKKADKNKLPTTAVTKTIRKNRKYKPRPTAKKPKQAVASTPKPAPKVSKVPKPPKPIPKKDRMENASKDKRMAAWAKANAKMIRKSGTAKQRAILDRVENKPKKSAALKAGYPGNRNY
jgi:hypothetical protein